MINSSGIRPVEYKCLVLPEEVEEISKGGIVMFAGGAKEREQMAQMRAHLIAVGGNAFDDWKGEKPEVGVKVLINKYAGYTEKGDDGKTYRVLQDKDIVAIRD